MEWYISKNGEKQGPYDNKQLGELIERKVITPTDLVWRQGLVEWVSVSEVPGLFSPPPAPNKSHSYDSKNNSNFTDDIPKDIKSTPARNYIHRHWSGELSLAKSFWVNGFLLNIIVTVSFLSAILNIDVSESPTLYSLAAMSIWILGLPIYVWQVVGIWRAANNYKVIKNKTDIPWYKFSTSTRWDRAAKFMVVMGILRTFSDYTSIGLPQISEYWKIATGNDPIGEYQIRVLRNASEIEISGAIAFGLTDEVEKSLKAHPAVKIVHLNSEGGRVAEARKLRDLIEENGLSTYTARGCYSACVIAFSAGKERLIEKDANLGLHQYAFPGMNSADFEFEYAQDRKYLEARGIDTAFLAKAYSTPQDQMWKPSHQELYNARMITGYPQSDQVGLSTVGLDEINNIEAGIEKIPLYAALAKKEPKIYEQVIMAMKDGFQRGESMPEVRAKTLPLIEQVYSRHLPYSSPTALREAVQLIVDEIIKINSVDPVACHYFLNPNPSKPLDMNKYVSKDTQHRELKVMGDVIESSNKNKYKLASEDQFNALIEPVITKLHNSIGEDIQLIADPSLLEQNKQKSCRVIGALYLTILDLPDSQALPLLRNMMASQ